MEKIRTLIQMRNSGPIWFVFILLGFNFGLLQAKEKQYTRYVLTLEGKLNVREKPIDGKVIFQLERGESVTVKENSQSIEWQEVIARSGSKGFVSSEFLSKMKPEDLENAKLFGSLSFDTEGSRFRSLAIRIQGQWFSANDHLVEAYFLEKKMLQEKEKAFAYERTDIAGEFSPETKEITGCQEVGVIKGSLTAFKKINTLRNSVFAIFGSKIGDKVRSDLYNPSEKISRLLDISTKSIFKKKHLRQPELEFLKRGDFYTVKTPAKDYLFIRYAIKVESKEKSYYVAIYEFNNEELGKRIFEKFDVLMSEQAIYGGQYYFLDAFDLYENGVPILIFHHNGYDGYINEFARIKNNHLESMFLTGGDAC
ncbi:SH3 domain-containing protein [Leptospira borgpetersenii]|uniref:SH3 domain protein n=1 Tax=Leptospira borgpetersenii serovar Javanica str. UI 09931 TaxID=1049767 RepID=A0AAV3JA58_LEPBO|nr:SH3 domain-containing protein [Leptospira borgpetersenii]AXX16931.1 SH3 domain-containing protein [Leptospira borgpetersenii serovar Ceylonica]EKQ93838.1 SH3 domain protein [Leptospira borgpetersenii str. UI 09149]EMN57466.1 SH3 domain protein [Leptospira borgpetersenii serovar Javanica str. MK146]EPG57425.1 SH3 domain protein [Leptospira borgpetersenii serovar Javanica str. UI 09931]MDQ7243321.1 SH3 domain-containing protein [Leptospira borgpetersenii]